MKKKHKDEMLIELNGSVNFVEYKRGKKTVTPIDGELILEVVLYAFTEGLKLFENDKNRHKVNKKKTQKL